MPKVFISYRRADSITITGRIHDRLASAYGEEHIFKDVDDIPIGVDFRRILEYEVRQADVLLVIIGPKWLKTRDESGRFRLMNPDDFVRIELETALDNASTLIVPILVHGATMPLPVDLPESLRGIVYRNGITVREDPDFNRDIYRLIQQIDNLAATSVPSLRRRLVTFATLLFVLVMAGVFFAFSSQIGHISAIEDTPAARRTVLDPKIFISDDTYGTGITARLFSQSPTMNIRAGPSYYDDVVTIVHDYDTVTVYPGGRQGNWVPIMFGDYQGWFDASQLSWRPIYGWRIDSPKPSVILRLEPLFDADMVADVHSGDSIYYAYRPPNDDWAFVVVDEYHAGWLYLQDGTFIELSG